TLQKDLDPTAAILDGRKARLAHDPLQHHASTHRHLGGIGFEPFVITLTEGRVQLARERITPEVVRERRARRPPRRKLGAPFRDQFALIDYLRRIAHDAVKPLLSKKPRETDRDRHRARRWCYRLPHRYASPLCATDPAHRSESGVPSSRPTWIP